MSEKVPRFGADVSRIEAPLGTQFEIDLPAEVGRLWELASHPVGVELVGDRIHPASEEQGAGSTQRLLFRAIKKGEEQLPLRFGRPLQEADDVRNPTIVVQ